MAERNTPSSNPDSDRPAARGAVEGTHVVPADYGMSGSKDIRSPIVPLLWLLVPFFGCVAYGILTR